MLADQDIAKLYQNGISAGTIAVRDGRSSATIINRLKAQNIPRRRRGDANRRCDIITAGRFYDMGLSTNQIGHLMGLHPTTVLKALQAHGYPIRSVETGVKVAFDRDELERWFGSLTCS